MIKRIENALIISGLLVGFILVGVPIYIGSKVVDLFSPNEDDSW